MVVMTVVHSACLLGDTDVVMRYQVTRRVDLYSAPCIINAHYLSVSKANNRQPTAASEGLYVARLSSEIEVSDFDKDEL